MNYRLVILMKIISAWKILNDDLLHVLTSNLTFLIDSYLHIHQKSFEEIY